MSANWWGTEQNVSKRFQIEYKVMKDQFGNNAVLHIPKGAGEMHWKVTVNVALAELEEERRRHILKVVYPTNYPSYAPAVYVVDPAITGARHMYGDGRLCLFNPGEGANHGWNPARSTALSVTVWGIQWLYVYWTYTFTGQWLGDEHSVKRRDNAPINPSTRDPRERLELLRQRRNQS